MEMQTEKRTVLVVDDMRENIEILGRILSGQYRVKVAMSGTEALKVLRTPPFPDIVLLDIMMPEIDGYEVCRQMKADPSTSEVPVVFISALCDDADEFKGLELGAVDYITKPFNPKLVERRVRTHLALSAAQQELRKYNMHLEDTVRRRTSELAAAHERLKRVDGAKGAYLRAISHELRTPANGVLGIAQLAIDEIPDRHTRDRLAGLFDRSSARLLETIDNSLRLAELQAGDAAPQVLPFSRAEAVRSALDRVLNAGGTPRDRLHIGAVDDQTLLGDRDLAVAALSTLLRAMLRLAAAGAVVTVRAPATMAAAAVILETEADRLPDHGDLESLFEPFSDLRTATAVEEMGLSLPLAVKDIEAMGGNVSIERLPRSVLRLECRFVAGSALAS